jgi:hypothetical protein
MKVRSIITFAFVAAIAGGYLWSWSTDNTVWAQQKRGRSTAARTVAPKKDYSHFDHRTKEHIALACNSCHLAPTANWSTASAFPDVADYPGHASCVRCHKNEFFKGARPVICSICHVKTSPREEARLSFAKPSATTQFETIFPHDRHQDVIAAVSSPRRLESAHAVQQTVSQKYNNCTICHQDRTSQIVTAPVEGFSPPLGTFKTAPSGHASCFSCHYQNQKPTRLECAGCHQIAAQDLTLPAVPVRLSLKFTHTREQHVAECTTCHINITKASTVRGLKPDVPVTACATCHKTSTDKNAATFETEVSARDASATFVCAKCHTASIGSQKLPASHRALFSQ